MSNLELFCPSSSSRVEPACRWVSTQRKGSPAARGERWAFADSGGIPQFLLPQLGQQSCLIDSSLRFFPCHMPLVYEASWGKLL